MVKGRAGTTTSDYKRHGTTTMFAAVNALDGTVIGSCMDKHRHEESLKFLATVDREVSKTSCGSYDLGQLRHPQTQGRGGLDGQASPVPAALHPDLKFLWLNLVEGWFRELTSTALPDACSTACPT